MKTEMQKRIEMNVTNGLGYNSETKFRHEDWGLDLKVEGVPKVFVKNTEEGLKRHLYGMDKVTIGRPRLSFSQRMVIAAYVMSALATPIIDYKPSTAHTWIHGLQAKYSSYMDTWGSRPIEIDDTSGMPGQGRKLIL